MFLIPRINSFFLNCMFSTSATTHKTTGDIITTLTITVFVSISSSHCKDVMWYIELMKYVKIYFIQLPN